MLPCCPGCREAAHQGLSPLISHRRLTREAQDEAMHPHTHGPAAGMPAVERHEPRTRHRGYAAPPPASSRPNYALVGHLPCHRAEARWRRGRGRRRGPVEERERVAPTRRSTFRRPDRSPGRWICSLVATAAMAGAAAPLARAGSRERDLARERSPAAAFLAGQRASEALLQQRRDKKGAWRRGGGSDAGVARVAPGGDDAGVYREEKY
nr:unnamed protein product [Digitaria exilis]